MGALFDWRFVPLAVILLGAAGCHGPARLPAHQFGDEARPTKEKRLIGKPFLQTNDVLAIAQEAASRLRFRLEDYVCDTPFLAPMTNINQWIVHFRRDPPVPDDELFVIIDDKTRETKTFQP